MDPSAAGFYDKLGFRPLDNREQARHVADLIYDEPDEPTVELLQVYGRQLDLTNIEAKHVTSVQCVVRARRMLEDKKKDPNVLLSYDHQPRATVYTCYGSMHPQRFHDLAKEWLTCDAPCDIANMRTFFEHAWRKAD